MNLPCPRKSDCGCSTEDSDPFSNISAELPDSRIHIGIVDIPGGKCYCLSEVSQQEAEDCAKRCLTWNPPPYSNPGDYLDGDVTNPPPAPPNQGNPNAPNPPHFPRGPITYGNPPGPDGSTGGGTGGGGTGSWYCNTAQTCEVIIGGTKFCYTVPAGTVCSTSQADADARAYSIACSRVESQGTICSGPITFADTLPQGGCLNEAYDFVIMCSSTTPPTDVDPWTFEITDGALPPGLTLVDYGGTSQTALITGITTAAGTYTFTVTVTPVYGDSSSKEYTIVVLEINEDAMPDAVNAVAYSEYVTASGGTGNYEFEVAGGSLPTGLTMDLDGKIHGTPTVSGDFSFTVLVTDIG